MTSTFFTWDSSDSMTGSERIVSGSTACDETAPPFFLAALASKYLSLAAFAFSASLAVASLVCIDRGQQEKVKRWAFPGYDC